MRSTCGAVLLSIFALGACSSIPDAGLTYYPVKTGVGVTSIMTASCSAKLGDNAQNADEELQVQVSYIVTQSYFADIDRPLGFDFAEIEGALSAGSIAVELEADGRLRSINGESEGAGGEIVSLALDAASAAISVAKGFPSRSSQKAKANFRDSMGTTVQRNVTPICSYLSTLKSKAYVFKKRWNLDGLYTGSGALNIGSLQLSAVNSSEKPPRILAPVFPKPKVTLIAEANPYDEEPGSLKPQLPYGTRFSGTIDTSDRAIAVQRPELVRLKFNVNNPFASGTSLEETATLIVPSRDLFAFPVPTSGFFGSSKFSLTLGAPGNVSKFSFGSKSGISQAASSARSLYDAIDAETAEEKLARLTLENDIASEQLRAVRCAEGGPDC